MYNEQGKYNNMPPAGESSLACVLEHTVRTVYRRMGSSGGLTASLLICNVTSAH